MLRYYFDIRIDNKWFVDREGSFLVDRISACDELVGSLVELLAHETPNHPHQQIGGEVREESSKAFFASSIEMRSNWL